MQHLYAGLMIVDRLLSGAQVGHSSITLFTQLTLSCFVIVAPVGDDERDRLAELTEHADTPGTTASSLGPFGNESPEGFVGCFKVDRGDVSTMSDRSTTARLSVLETSVPPEGFTTLSAIDGAFVRGR